MTFKELENMIGSLENWKIENNLYKCPYCNKETRKAGILQHIKMQHTEEGKKLKSQISYSMKKAHQEGRANNWQDSRRKNGKEGSYPEQFFKEVIKNEFDDKNYIFQYRISKYSLDFAWPAKKLYIEIDGKQHLENQDYDIERDLYLKENGWIGLRIFWAECYSNPKYHIEMANAFINNGSISLDKFYVQKGNIYKVKDSICLKHRATDKRFSFELDGFVFDNRENYELYISRKKSLTNINIDFNKLGCYTKLGKCWGITGQKASKYYQKYFK